MKTDADVAAAKEYADTMLKCEEIVNTLRTTYRALGRAEGAVAGFIAGLAVAAAVAIAVVNLRSPEPETGGDNAAETRNIGTA